VVVPNADPIGQPAGVPETAPSQSETIETTAEEGEAATDLVQDDRAGVDLDTSEGQAQAQPVGGEAAVYEPAGDEDDDLIEGGEEYEEGDYDDELDPEAEGEGEAEGEAEGLDAQVEGEDEDPYGVDGFVNGLDNTGDVGEVVEGEEVYDEYEDEADPELGAEGAGKFITSLGLLNRLMGSLRN
jgi:hypothetical protein